MKKKPEAARTTSEAKGGFLNTLLRRPIGGTNPNNQAQERRNNEDVNKEQPERLVLCRDGINRSDKEGLIRLYEALVPNDKARNINVTMIFDEGISVFEATIGTANFQKLKRYFGIGCKPCKKGTIKEQEISLLLEKLRTVENAQYYIDGYKEVLEKAAAKLCDAPEEMTTLERAKFVRMYHTIFVGYHYFFQQDFKTVDNIFMGRREFEVDFAKVFKNNQQRFNPEELFSTCSMLGLYADNSLVYELVCQEFECVEKRTQKEILRFAELRINENGRFVSVNDSPGYQTFSSLRTIKMKVHQEIGVYPMEMFAYKQRMKNLYFEDLYQLSRIFKTESLETFETHSKMESYIEGSREILKERVYYKPAEGFEVSGQAEINRIVRMIDYVVKAGFKMRRSGGKECDAGICMAALKFLQEMKYTNFETDCKKEFEYADALIERDSDGALAEYKNHQIDGGQLKSRLKVDEAFEREHLGGVKIATPAETAIKFAIDNGYVSDEGEISEELLNNVILPSNELHFTKLAKCEINRETLKVRIGFDEAFAEMYFCLAKVDIAAIENQLLELKRGFAKKGEMKHWALLINLYCYLVENKVPCGPKNKPPKGNKGLKVANLRAQLE